MNVSVEILQLLSEVGYMSCFKNDKAIDTLQNYVLVREPDHMSAQCFLGMALKMSGKDSEAKDIFDHVVKNGNDDERVIASVHLGI